VRRHNCALPHKGIARKDREKGSRELSGACGKPLSQKRRLCWIARIMVYIYILLDKNVYINVLWSWLSRTGHWTRTAALRVADGRRHQLILLEQKPMNFLNKLTGPAPQIVCRDCARCSRASVGGETGSEPLPYGHQLIRSLL